MNLFVGVEDSVDAVVVDLYCDDAFVMFLSQGKGEEPEQEQEQEQEQEVALLLPMHASVRGLLLLFVL